MSRLDVLQEMKITANETYQKGKLIPFVSWKIDSATTFGDHQVDFDFPGRRVVRSTEGSSVVIAQIHDGHKGTKLPDFFGSVESDDFIVTKRKKDWLSGLTGNVVFEVTLKDCGLSVANMAMRFDYHSTFRVGDVLDLKLTRDDRANNYRNTVEGTCAKEHQELAEVLACLLLHHNEEQGPSS